MQNNWEEHFLKISVEVKILSKKKYFSFILLCEYQKIPPLADPEDESPTGDKEPPQEEPPPKETSSPPPLLIVTNDGEVGMPLIVFEYVCERHMPYGSKVIFFQAGIRRNAFSFYDR